MGCLGRLELSLGKKLRDQNENLNDDELGPSMSAVKCQCHVCIKNLAGDGHKQKKDLLYRIKTLYRVCRQHACKDHLIAVCVVCKDK